MKLTLTPEMLNALEKATDKPDWLIDCATLTGAARSQTVKTSIASSTCSRSRYSWRRCRTSSTARCRVS